MEQLDILTQDTSSANSNNSKIKMEPTEYEDRSENQESINAKINTGSTLDIPIANIKSDVDDDSVKSTDDMDEKPAIRNKKRVFVQEDEKQELKFWPNPAFYRKNLKLKEEKDYVPYFVDPNREDERIRKKQKDKYREGRSRERQSRRSSSLSRTRNSRFREDNRERYRSSRSRSHSSRRTREYRRRSTSRDRRSSRCSSCSPHRRSRYSRSKNRTSRRYRQSRSNSRSRLYRRSNSEDRQTERAVYINYGFPSYQQQEWLMLYPYPLLPPPHMFYPQQPANQFSFLYQPLPLAQSLSSTHIPGSYGCVPLINTHQTNLIHPSIPRRSDFR